jgi:hypothetical protein
MIQDCDHPWRQPYPLPLVSAPPGGQDIVLPSEDKRAASAGAGKKSLPAEISPAFSDDDYQWMMLL